MVWFVITVQLFNSDTSNTMIGRWTGVHSLCILCSVCRAQCPVCSFFSHPAKLLTYYIQQTCWGKSRHIVSLNFLFYLQCVTWNDFTSTYTLFVSVNHLQYGILLVTKCYKKWTFIFQSEFIQLIKLKKRMINRNIWLIMLNKTCSKWNF